jgi:hypothetical protein
MSKPNVPMSKRHPLGPRLTINVLAETINTAMRANSGHCMIAESIKLQVPMARNVAVDISTIRFSDLEKGLRYVYLTPRPAQNAIVDFDEGTPPKPFSFKLQGAHVTRAGRLGGAKSKGTKKTRVRLGDKLPRRAVLVQRDKGKVPDRVGGKRPPQLHTRREFGLRSFRAASLSRLANEQAPINEIDPEA